MRYLPNHRKCQKAHSGIVSSRQGLGQARTLARRLYNKQSATDCFAYILSLFRPLSAVITLIQSKRADVFHICPLIFLSYSHINETSPPDC